MPGWSAGVLEAVRGRAVFADEVGEVGDHVPEPFSVFRRSFLSMASCMRWKSAGDGVTCLSTEPTESPCSVWVAGVRPVLEPVLAGGGEKPSMGRGLSR